MKLDIIVIDNDTEMQGLLQAYLTRLGHSVLTFKDPTFCPLFRNLLDEDCRCSREKPCSDIVIIDMEMPKVCAFDFLQLQKRRGCKVLVKNKAVMSTGVAKEVKDAMMIFGCHHIVKPFRLSEIGKWVEECSERIKESVRFVSGT